ncbi:GNAT family N-acetyltransferase [uncultured Tateyamaria sp.]|uniref:GNAT family N-acetyltransferase n=1 Tax=uncultured Tateyamaria sp. TaxID=455651 RepID=UPI00262C602A|nr:GNAT family N-acetyltransferase [uncultured Tateyamaria sp.]
MIRPAVAADAGWIADIWNGIIADTLVTFTTVPKTPDAVAQMIAEQTVLVADTQAGFATFGPFRSGPGYAATVEHTVLLSRTARGQGIGTALMQALITEAQDAGHRVMVAAISGENPPAVAFHAALGFQMVAHMPQVGRKSGRWLDLILMQKVLTGVHDGDALPADRV